MARRLAIVAVCAVSLALCCGLAWWQWERFESASGTFQNLGYVLQWPLFGLFPAFMFWRIRTLNRRAKAEQTERPGQTEPRADAAGPPQRRTRPAPVAAAPTSADDVEDPEDRELAAYNRYLAELNARDHEVR